MYDFIRVRGEIFWESSADSLHWHRFQSRQMGIALQDKCKTKNPLSHALVARTETFFSVLQKEPYGALLIDTDEKFLNINPEFTAITGYTVAE